MKFSELEPLSHFKYDDKHWLKPYRTYKFKNGIANAAMFNPENPWWDWGFFDMLICVRYFAYFEPDTEVELIYEYS